MGSKDSTFSRLRIRILDLVVPECGTAELTGKFNCTLRRAGEYPLNVWKMCVQGKPPPLACIPIAILCSRPLDVSNAVLAVIWGTLQPEPLPRVTGVFTGIERGRRARRDPWGAFVAQKALHWQHNSILACPVPYFNGSVALRPYR